MSHDSRHRGPPGPKSAPPINQEAGARSGSPADEQAGAAESIQRTLKAWRSAKGSASSEKSAVPQGGGKPLPEDVRKRMEPQLGADLSGVQVHTGGESETAAKNFGARAFTVGSDVHFGAGEYSPGNKTGDKLLAHELTHVVQGQKSGIQRKADGGGEDGGHEVSKPEEPAEVEADEKSAHVAEALHGGAKGDHGGDAKGDHKGDAKGGGAKEAAKPISAKLTGVALKIYRDPGAKSKVVPPADAKGKDAKAKVVDPLQDIRDALAAGSRVKLSTAWHKLADADKAKLGLPDIEKAFDVGPAFAFNMMQAQKMAFTAPLAKKFLSTPDPSQWSLQLNPMWAGFLAALPDATTVTKAELKALGGWVGGSKSHDVFQKVYPPLNNATYDATLLKSTNWGDGQIGRLYTALQAAPVQHVQASSGGFFLGTHHKLGGAKKWQDLGFAWQHGTKMVLPLSSAGAGGGGAGHDMTGGTGSGEALEKGKSNVTHFQGSVTHEVGHAVSNMVGGDAWATTRNNFAAAAADTWSKALFDDAVAQKEIDAATKAGTLKKVDVAPAAEVRLYWTNKVQNIKTAPGKATVQMLDKTVAHISPQALGHYYTATHGREAYQVTAANVVGGKTYAYLSRFGNALATYDAKTFNEKVSWYSISSPAEWFAENYAHYYRLEGAHPIADVKTKFDTLDKYKFDKTAAGGAGSLVAPGGEAHAGDQPAGAQGGGGGPQTGGQPGQKGKDAPQPNPAEADIHRMSFPW